MLVGHHHLAIEPGRLHAELGQGLGLFGQLGGPVMAVAGEQAHRVAVDAGEDAVTVEFHFVAPVALGRSFHQGRQLRLERIGQGGFPGAAEFGFARGPGLACGFARRGLGFARDQRTFAEHAVRFGLEDVVVRLRARLGIVGLDQQPLLLLAGQVGAKQVPDPREFLALQAKAQLALGIGRVRIFFGDPHTTVPDNHVTGAIMAFGDLPFEVGVVQRVVFDVHGQAPDLWVQRRALGDGPAFQGTVQLQAKVVVQVAGVVFLDAVLQGVGGFFALGMATHRFRGGVEIALARVLLQRLGHGGVLRLLDGS
ncbi:hypothetical protein D3C81_958090 [compost metagenome]